jgi:hypothetical protein
MNKFLRLACIVILALALAITILRAKASSGSAASKPQVLVEAMIVQARGKFLEDLGCASYVPNQQVTIPLAKLLWLLADPNNAKVLASAKLKTPPGQTGTITTGEKLKYLVKKDDGSFEQKTTEMPIGTMLKVTPIIDTDGNILLAFKFVHCTVVEPPREIDSETGLPVGEPVIGLTVTDNARTLLKPADPMIAAGSSTPDAQRLILIRAEILK